MGHLSNRRLRKFINLKALLIILMSLGVKVLHANSVYDDELKHFFERERPDIEFLKKRNQQTAETYPSVIKEDINLIKSALRKPYSIFHDDNKQLLCFFVTPDIDPPSWPFLRVFNDVDEEIGNQILVGSFCYEAKTLDLEVLELFDAEVSPANMSRLSNLSSMRHLGLPARGMSFLKGISFPSQTETLVVRNSFLNVHFFEAF